MKHLDKAERIMFCLDLLYNVKKCMLTTEVPHILCKLTFDILLKQIEANIYPWNHFLKLFLPVIAVVIHQINKNEQIIVSDMG